MEDKDKETRQKIEELRKRYARLALNCRAAGIRVNSGTVEEYMHRLKELQAMLN